MDINVTTAVIDVLKPTVYGKGTVKIYIAGPMTGYDDWNRQAFLDAEILIAGRYGDVSIFNPGKYLATDNDLTYEEVIAIDLATIIICDAMYCLKGWKNSVGAYGENMCAKLTGKIIFYEEAQFKVSATMQ